MSFLPAGLLTAWVINDAEEWFTMAPWSARHAETIGKLPVTVPWPQEGMPARQAHVAIGFVGTFIAAASLRGHQTKGQSRLFRSALLAFGLHGFTHIGQSVVFRGYTPGVVTGTVVVIPFWVAAEIVRRKAGETYSAAELLSAVGMLAALPAVVALARKITGR